MVNPYMQDDQNILSYLQKHLYYFSVYYYNFKYIEDNNKRPSSTNKNKDIKIYGNWLNNQSRNYIKNNRAMNNNELKNLWIEFINDPKYKQFL